MRTILKVLLAVVLVPIFLIVFTVVHEEGHTLLARALGDPNSVFYLYQVEGDHTCLGCNIYDQTKLSWGANLVVSLGGLIATQIVAVGALLLLRSGIRRPVLRRLLAIVAVTYAFLDVIVQVFQGSLYNLATRSFPTNVDLTDVMLLLQQRTGADQLLLKSLLLAASVIYLAVFLWLYRGSRAARPAPPAPRLVAS